MPVVTDYTALITGSSWSGIEVATKPVIVTFSFAAAAPSYIGSINGFTGATAATFQAFTPAEQVQARAALAEWAAASGIVFLEVAPGQGDISFQSVDFNTTSYAGAGGVAEYPFGDWNGFTFPSFRDDLGSPGDVFMNSVFESGGMVNYGTLLHEIGHALGLKHPTEIINSVTTTHDQVLATDDALLTIMAQGAGTAVLKQLDKDAVAFLYGAAGTGGVHTGSASGANSAVSAWSWNATTARLTQFGFAVADVMRGISVADTMNGLAGDDQLFGLAGNDILNGGDGNDLLEGGSGNDRMTGGIGDDTYFVSGSDVVVEAAGGGDDFVHADKSYTLTANVESLQLSGANLIGRGNGLANVMFGDGVSGDRLYGLAGVDYIVGAGGADILYGGTEADQLYGGAGADRLYGDAGADYMDGGDGNDSYYVDDSFDAVAETSAAVAGGIDTVYSSISFALGANLERLTLTGTAGVDATGNGLANILTGNSAANVLTGAAGNDMLKGAGGDDRFDFSSAIAMASLGRDRITDFAGGAGAGDVIAIDDTWLSPLGITTAAQLAAAFVVVGLDLRLTLDASDSITLAGAAALALSADDFLIT